MKNNKLTATAMIISILCCLFCVDICVFADSETFTDHETIDRQITEDVKKYHIPGMAVAVVDKNNVLFEKTYGNCENIYRPFIIGSMSKSFTALAVMQLSEQGLINLNSPIDEYINASEWFDDSDNYSRITVKDLLNHTSGITTYQSFGSLKSTDLYGSYVYANANYGLLGLIIESVSGMSYEDYISKNIFEPLGMDNSAASLEKSKENGLIEGYRNYFGIPVAGGPDYPHKTEKGSWTNIPAGYLSASLSDMEKYLQMYLNGGESIVGSGSINDMFYNSVPAEDGVYYGMGWNYSEEMFSKPMLWHTGLVENYTSNMFIIPDEGIAVVVLVNMNDYLVCNNLIGNIIMPLLGEEKQELPNLYLILHFLIDMICLAIFVTSAYSVFTLKKWRLKTSDKKIYVSDILRHIVIPAVLLILPLIMEVPYKVIWLFVKDISIVLFANAAILTAVGIYKTVILLRKK